MIIDFRIRPPVGSFRDTLLFDSSQWLAAHGHKDDGGGQQPPLLRGREEARSAVEMSMDLFFDEMASAGITHGVIMGRDAGPPWGTVDNEEIAEFCAEHAATFVGFGGVRSDKPKTAVRAVKSVGSLGLRGITLDNGLFGLHEDDPSLMPIYETAAEEDLIVALTVSQLVGPDLSYVHPDPIRAVAKRFPGLSIVIAHACWPWTTLACALAFECQNVYLLPDCYMNESAPGVGDYVNAANSFHVDHMLFGTAYPVRPLGSSVRNFMALPLTDEARENLLWRNAQHLLDWPKE